MPVKRSIVTFLPSALAVSFVKETRKPSWLFREPTFARGVTTTVALCASFHSARNVVFVRIGTDAS